jgi:Flp pilus assembly protein TadG
MIKQRLQKILYKSERGQAIILVAFAIIGLVAMVGLVIDTGILLIEYGKLKRGVDAAAVSAAQQYRLSGNVLDKPALENAAYNFLQLNQSTDIVSVTVHSCEDDPSDTFVDANANGVWDSGETLTADWNLNGTFDPSQRPELCNPDPIGHPNNNRKLVEVVASKNVYFGFLAVIGITQTTVTASAVGEAATIDLVLVIDTSASMAYETVHVEGTTPVQDAGDDPSVCNLNNSCQPMRAVKDIALDFLDTLYFPYDRVAVVTMTSQTPGGDRNPRLWLPLNSNKDTVRAAINGIKVFEPRDCDGTDAPGTCLNYDGSGVFTGAICQTYQLHLGLADANPSSCPSSNVGGALSLARAAFTDPSDPDFARLDAFWVVVTLLGGPANATDSTMTYPFGFCPEYTWPEIWDGAFCRDKRPSVRHADTDPLVPYTNPVSGATSDISYYDADDYARDMADNLATLTTGEGVTIFTIGLGAQIRSTSTVEAGEDPAGEALLQYIAECAGEPGHVCDNPVKVINHGQYFYAPNSNALTDIFDRIAKNIATKISQ